MRQIIVPALTGLALMSCGEPAAAPAPETAPADVMPATQPAPALSIEDSCRQATERLYGQTGASVTFDASDFSLSWPAPVDGGRLRFACSVVGSQVTLSNDDQRQSIDLSSPASAPVQQEAH